MSAYVTGLCQGKLLPITKRPRKGAIRKVGKSKWGLVIKAKRRVQGVGIVEYCRGSFIHQEKLKGAVKHVNQNLCINHANSC